ncbi:hypothetical protein D7B24_003330 [Verticillium nonalfalfae]|uniref:C2H2-type domain-containing protein n=1 Tax=Verticillium nonalfalfae TaxID=1051616 RepID=A0A3M9XXP9_9PEZI|nr:uncharacterized protein D7B24_003330 [Verticillium nonalfalfae]RNJ52552.1 hypothetical protein D7B24_003330 [Verticillium nonalfalfae]
MSTPQHLFHLQHRRGELHLLQTAGEALLWTPVEMLPHTHAQQHQKPSQNKRRRRTTSVPGARACPHCGRTFKRTEHLERHIRTQYSPRSHEGDSQPFRVTDDQRSRLIAATEAFRDVLDPTFKFPSRHALTRYVTSFFEGFHSHMPFIHVATWRLSDHALELILGIAALGSQYCFERRNSESLFHAGQAILVERIRREAGKFGAKSRSYLGLHDPSPLKGATRPEHVARDPFNEWATWEPIETVRALVLLMGYATWEPKVALLQEAFTLQGLLAQVLRDLGLGEETHPSLTDGTNGSQAVWEAWVRQESVRRTKLIAFSFLHIHSIAYNVYPVLRSNEINLRLPCSTKEWKAPNAMQWQAAHSEISKQQLFFQHALSLLLKKADDGMGILDPIPTPLGNYVLLHGLLQRIYIVRDLSLPVMDHSAQLPAEEVDKLESGLRSWTSGWQQAPESTLDPNNENGPIPFTSSSLLGLAYVRIYLHLGPYRLLETRDPRRIARALAQSPAVERSDGVVTALLYSTHMLSIPVRLGVDRVARSQAFFWSVRHSLSGLECAVLLSKWLFSLTETLAATPLTDSEDRILHWVWCIVDEACMSVDFVAEEYNGAIEREPRSLGLAVLMIWAHFFKSNTQWPFINVMGQALQEYRKLVSG